MPDPKLNNNLNGYDPEQIKAFFQEYRGPSNYESTTYYTGSKRYLLSEGLVDPSAIDSLSNEEANLKAMENINPYTQIQEDFVMEGLYGLTGALGSIYEMGKDYVVNNLNEIKDDFTNDAVGSLYKYSANTLLTLTNPGLTLVKNEVDDQLDKGDDQAKQSDYNNELTYWASRNKSTRDAFKPVYDTNPNSDWDYAGVNKTVSSVGYSLGAMAPALLTTAAVGFLTKNPLLTAEVGEGLFAATWLARGAAALRATNAVKNATLIGRGLSAVATGMETGTATLAGNILNNASKIEAIGGFSEGALEASAAYNDMYQKYSGKVDHESLDKLSKDVAGEVFAENIKVAAADLALTGLLGATSKVTGLPILGANFAVKNPVSYAISKKIFDQGVEYGQEMWQEDINEKAAYNAANTIKNSKLAGESAKKIANKTIKDYESKSLSDKLWNGEILASTLLTGGLMNSVSGSTVFSDVKRLNNLNSNNVSKLNSILTNASQAKASLSEKANAINYQIDSQRMNVANLQSQINENLNNPEVVKDLETELSNQKLVLETLSQQRKQLLNNIAMDDAALSSNLNDYKQYLNKDYFNKIKEDITNDQTKSDEQKVIELQDLEFISSSNYKNKIVDRHDVKINALKQTLNDESLDEKTRSILTEELEIAEKVRDTYETTFKNIEQEKRTSPMSEYHLAAYKGKLKTKYELHNKEAQDKLNESEESLMLLEQGSEIGLIKSEAVTELIDNKNNLIDQNNKLINDLKSKPKTAESVRSIFELERTNENLKKDINKLNEEKSNYTSLIDELIEGNTEEEKSKYINENLKTLIKQAKNKYNTKLAEIKNQGEVSDNVKSIQSIDDAKDRYKVSLNDKLAAEGFLQEYESLNSKEYKDKQRLAKAMIGSKSDLEAEISDINKQLEEIKNKKVIGRAFNYKKAKKLNERLEELQLIQEEVNKVITENKLKELNNLHPLSKQVDNIIEMFGSERYDAVEVSVAISEILNNLDNISNEQLFNNKYFINGLTSILQIIENLNSKESNTDLEIVGNAISNLIEAKSEYDTLTGVLARIRTMDYQTLSFEVNQFNELGQRIPVTIKLTDLFPDSDFTEINNAKDIKTKKELVSKLVIDLVVEQSKTLNESKSQLSEIFLNNESKFKSIESIALKSISNLDAKLNYLESKLDVIGDTNLTDEVRKQLTDDLNKDIIINENIKQQYVTAISIINLAEESMNDNISSLINDINDLKVMYQDLINNYKNQLKVKLDANELTQEEYDEKVNFVDSANQEELLQRVNRSIEFVKMKNQNSNLIDSDMYNVLKEAGLENQRIKEIASKLKLDIDALKQKVEITNPPKHDPKYKIVGYTRDQLQKLLNDNKSQKAGSDYISYSGLTNYSGNVIYANTVAGTVFDSLVRDFLVNNKDYQSLFTGNLSENKDLINLIEDKLKNAQTYKDEEGNIQYVFDNLKDAQKEKLRQDVLKTVISYINNTELHERLVTLLKDYDVLNGEKLKDGGILKTKDVITVPYTFDIFIKDRDKNEKELVVKAINESIKEKYDGVKFYDVSGKELSIDELKKQLSNNNGKLDVFVESKFKGEPDIILVKKQYVDNNANKGYSSLEILILDLKTGKDVNNSAKKYGQQVNIYSKILNDIIPTTVNYEVGILGLHTTTETNGDVKSEFKEFTKEELNISELPTQLSNITSSTDSISSNLNEAPQEVKTAAVSVGSEFKSGEYAPMHFTFSSAEPELYSSAELPVDDPNSIYISPMTTLLKATFDIIESENTKTDSLTVIDIVNWSNNNLGKGRFNFNNESRKLTEAEKINLKLAYLSNVFNSHDFLVRTYGYKDLLKKVNIEPTDQLLNVINGFHNILTINGRSNSGYTNKPVGTPVSQASPTAASPVIQSSKNEEPKTASSEITSYFNNVLFFTDNGKRKSTGDVKTNTLAEPFESDKLINENLLLENKEIEFKFDLNSYKDIVFFVKQTKKVNERSVIDKITLNDLITKEGLTNLSKNQWISIVENFENAVNNPSEENYTKFIESFGKDNDVWKDYFINNIFIGQYADINQTNTLISPTKSALWFDISSNTASKEIAKDGKSNIISLRNHVFKTLLSSPNTVKTTVKSISRGHLFAEERSLPESEKHVALTDPKGLYHGKTKLELAKLLIENKTNDGDQTKPLKSNILINATNDKKTKVIVSKIGYDSNEKATEVLLSLKNSFNEDQNYINTFSVEQINGKYYLVQNLLQGGAHVRVNSSNPNMYEYFKADPQIGENYLDSTINVNNNEVTIREFLRNQLAEAVKSKSPIGDVIKKYFSTFSTNGDSIVTGAISFAGRLTAIDGSDKYTFKSSNTVEKGSKLYVIIPQNVRKNFESNPQVKKVAIDSSNYKLLLEIDLSVGNLDENLNTLFNIMNKMTSTLQSETYRFRTNNNDQDNLIRAQIELSAIKSNLRSAYKYDADGNVQPVTSGDTNENIHFINRSITYNPVTGVTNKTSIVVNPPAKVKVVSNPTDVQEEEKDKTEQSESVVSIIDSNNIRNVYRELNNTDIINNKKESDKKQKTNITNSEELLNSFFEINKNWYDEYYTFEEHNRYLNFIKNEAMNDLLLSDNSLTTDQIQESIKLKLLGFYRDRMMELIAIPQDNLSPEDIKSLNDTITRLDNITNDLLFNPDSTVAINFSKDFNKTIDKLNIYLQEVESKNNEEVYDKTAVEINPKLKISLKIKSMLNAIPRNTNQALGMSDYYLENEVYNMLINNLATIDVLTTDKLQERLDILSKNNNVGKLVYEKIVLLDLIESLKEDKIREKNNIQTNRLTEEQVKSFKQAIDDYKNGIVNEIFSNHKLRESSVVKDLMHGFNMSKSTMKYLYIIDKKTKSGTTKEFTVTNANKQSLEEMNFKLESNKMNLLNINNLERNQTVDIVNNFKEELINLLNNPKTNSKEEFVDELQKLIKKSFNIDVTKTYLDKNVNVKSITTIKGTVEEFEFVSNSFMNNMILQSADNLVTQIKPYIADQNFIMELVNNSIFKNLLHDDAINKLISVPATFKNGDKIAYGFTGKRWITDVTYELSEAILNENHPMNKDSFTNQSSLLEKLKNEALINGVNIATLLQNIGVFELSNQLLINKKQDGTNLSSDNIHELQESDLYYFQLAMFFGFKPASVGNINYRNYFFPTMSDKKTQFGMASTYTDTKSYDDKKRSDFVINNILRGEINRIITMSGDNKNIVKYDTGKQLILTMPFLNNEEIEPGVTLKDYLNSKIANELGLEEVLNKLKSNTNIVKKINEFLNQEVSTLQSKIISNKLNKSSFGLDNLSEDKYKLELQDFLLNQMEATMNAYQLYVGDLADYYKSKSKDPNQQAKDTFDNVGKRLAAMIAPGKTMSGKFANESYIQLHLQDTEISSKYIKRVLDTISTTEDVISEEDWNKYLELRNNKNKSDSELSFVESIDDKLKTYKDYLSIESTDAQEYSTWREYLKTMTGLNKLNDVEYDILSRIFELQELLLDGVKTIGNKQERDGYKKELDKLLEKNNKLYKKFVGQTIKPVYTGRVWSDKDQKYTYNYVKSSSIPLFPSLTYGLPIDDLRKEMNKLERVSGKNVRASYSTANKVGQLKNAIKLWNKDGSFNKDSFKGFYKIENGTEILNTDNNGVNYIELDRKNWRLQTETPFKSKALVSQGTQLGKTLFNAESLRILSQLEGKDKLAQSYYNTYSKLVKTITDEVKQEFGLNDKYELNGDTTSEQLSSFIYNVGKVIESQLEGSAFTDNDVKNYQMYFITKDGNKVKFNSNEISLKDGKLINRKTNEIYDLKLALPQFKTPLWYGNRGVKLETILNVVANSRIQKIKFPGYMHILASQDGFIADSKGNRKEGMGIRFLDPKRTDSNLQYNVIDENGEVYSEVILAPKIKDNEGNLIDIANDKRYWNDDNTINLKMLPQEMLESIGFRIPTSGLMSGARFKVVGFVPVQNGDIAIFPSEFTKQMGADYDVDKQTFYNRFYKINDKGKITVTKDDSKEGLINELIKLHHDVYKTKELLKLITQPLNTDVFEDQVELFNSINSSEDKSLYSPLTLNYQINKIKGGSSGKSGTGRSSNAIVFNALFEQTRNLNQPITLNDTKVKDTNNMVEALQLKFNGKSYYFNELGLGVMQPGLDTGMEESDKNIGTFLAKYQQIAVDNEKLQYMAPLGISNEALDIVNLFNLAGVGIVKVKDITTGQDKNVWLVAALLQHPVVIDYLDSKKKGRVSEKEELNITSKQEKTDFSNLVVNNNFKSSEGIHSLFNQMTDDQMKEAIDMIYKKSLYVSQLMSAFNTDSKGVNINYKKNATKSEKQTKYIADLDLTENGFLGLPSVKIGTEALNFSNNAFEKLMIQTKRVFPQQEVTSKSIFGNDENYNPLFAKIARLKTPVELYKIAQATMAQKPKDRLPKNQALIQSIVESVRNTIDNDYTKLLKSKVNMHIASKLFSDLSTKDQRANFKSNLINDLKQLSSRVYLTNLKEGEVDLVKDLLLNNLFFNNIKYNDVKTKDGIKTYISKIPNLDETVSSNDIISSFTELYNGYGDLVIFKKNNQDYKIKDLLIDLVKYSLIDNQYDNIGTIETYIPSEFYEGLGVNEFVSLINDKLMINDPYVSSIFSVKPEDLENEDLFSVIKDEEEWDLPDTIDYDTDKVDFDELDNGESYGFNEEVSINDIGSQQTYNTIIEDLENNKQLNNYELKTTTNQLLDDLLFSTRDTLPLENPELFKLLTTQLGILNSLGVDINVSFINLKGSNYETKYGYYGVVDKKGIIVINTDPQVGNQKNSTLEHKIKTLTHELNHAILKNALNSNLLDEKSKEGFYNKMNNVMQEFDNYVETLTDDQKSEIKNQMMSYYAKGISSEDKVLEFIAEAFSNKKIMAILNEVKSSNKEDSLLERFYKAIKTLLNKLKLVLGIKSGNLLDVTYDVVFDLLDQHYKSKLGTKYVDVSLPYVELLTGINLDYGMVLDKFKMEVDNRNKENELNEEIIVDENNNNKSDTELKSLDENIINEPKLENYPSEISYGNYKFKTEELLKIRKEVPNNENATFSSNRDFLYETLRGYEMTDEDYAYFVKNQDIMNEIILAYNNETNYEGGVIVDMIDDILNKNIITNKPDDNQLSLFSSSQNNDYSEITNNLKELLNSKPKKTQKLISDKLNEMNIEDITNLNDPEVIGEMLKNMCK